MKTVEEILTKIESLDNLEKYQEIIDLIEALPAERLNYRINGRIRKSLQQYRRI